MINNRTISITLFNGRRPEPRDILLERVIALGKLTNTHGIIHLHLVVPLQLIDNLFFEEANVFRLYFVG
jgi:hypothetical protein